MVSSVFRPDTLVGLSRAMFPCLAILDLNLSPCSVANALRVGALTSQAGRRVDATFAVQQTESDRDLIMLMGDGSVLGPRV